MPVDIRKPLKKMLPVMLQARDANLNEADTVMRLVKLFEDVLGYDALVDVSREAQMKGKYVDVTLKVDGVTRLLVEAKAAGETLRERHIEQAENYASKNNYRWVLLTNGVVWNLYYVTTDGGVESTRAFSVDLSAEDGLEVASEKLALLHKQSIKKGELEDYWRMKTALSPSSIGRALMQEGVLALIRREIRKEEGLLIDIEDLAAAIHKMLSAEAREQIGPFKVRKKRSMPRKKKESATEDAARSLKEVAQASPTTADSEAPSEVAEVGRDPGASVPPANVPEAKA